MKAVGVREFKARLSQYLRDVQAGEVVLVTDRGKVVAEVRTPGTPLREESDVDRAMRRLAEKGGVIVGEPHDPDAYVVSPVRVPEGTSAALLAAEREDRW
jgi:antitoxin (DNA-binding transcriptional repressor) of toxin-antitoxin stability system